jgi:hypothetical protein
MEGTQIYLIKIAFVTVTSLYFRDWQTMKDLFNSRNATTQISH